MSPGFGFHGEICINHHKNGKHENMADEWLEIDKIKLYMKKAAEAPVPIAIGVGQELAKSQLAMHPRKQPEFLVKALKKEGFQSTRILAGTAMTDGPILTVTCEKSISKAKEAIKYFLKLNKLPQTKVVLLGPNGELDGDEAGDGDDTTAATAGQAEAADPRLEALKALARELAGQIGAIADTALQAKMAGALKKAVEMVNRGDADKAEPAMEQLQALVARFAGTPKPDGAAAQAADGWAAIAAKIEPQVLAALKANHPEAGKIRAIWTFAQEKAEAGDTATAVKAVQRLTPLLAVSAGPASAGGSKVLFEKTHLDWNSRKEQIKAKLDALHEAILDESQDAEFTTAAGKLQKVLGNFNEGLSDTLDALRNADTSDKRESLSKQAQAIASRYLSYLSSDPLVAHVDANPFDIKVDAAETLSAPLRLLQQQLSQIA